MLLLRFYHSENRLTVGNQEYKATCDVRNELNGRRQPSQIVKTYPKDQEQFRKPYMPRPFPTGVWHVKTPIWTDDIDYYPVKIPTSAVRTVLTWKTESGEYKLPDGYIQDDAFYHLHFAKLSKTTLGCIRLDSDSDAREIAEEIEDYLDMKEPVLLEVLN